MDLNWKVYVCVFVHLSRQNGTGRNGQQSDNSDFEVILVEGMKSDIG